MSAVLDPKISVVIPVYNGEAYIADTIQSVLRQDRPAHEIFVIDDGSTDSTPKILAGFGNRIRVQRIANTGGPSEPRNLGIREADGEWIALLDADDLWFRHKLMVEADYIRRFPGVGFFGCNYMARSHRGRLVRHFSRLVLRGYVFGRPLPNAFGRFLTENYIGTPSTAVFLKSAAIEAGLFDPRRKVVEDLEFFIRLAARTPVLLIPEILAFKRSHESNVSNDKVRLLSVHKEVLEEARERFDELIRRQHLQKDSAHGLALLCLDLGNAYFEAGDFKKAFDLYRSAAARDPRLSTCCKSAFLVFKKLIRQKLKVRLPS